MINEATLDITEAPGATGPLFDENPSATTSRIRPFVIGFLLLRGGVRRDEVTYSIHAHVSRDDVLLGMEDEEVYRLAEARGLPVQVHSKTPTFSPAWIPVDKT